MTITLPLGEQGVAESAGAATTKARAGSARAFAMVAILSLIQMLNYFDRSVAGLAATDIMREMKLTPRDYGLLASAFYSLYAISGILVGLTFSRRFRPRVILLWLIAAWALTQIPIFMAASFGVLIACRALLGAAESPSISLCVAGSHEWFPAERRSVPTAIVMVGPLIGSVIAPPILSYIMGAHGWRAGFATCGLLSAAMFVILLLFGRDGPDVPSPAPPAAKKPAGSGKGALAFWIDPMIIAVAMVGFCSYWVTAFVVSWLFPMLRLAFGYGQNEASWIVSGIYLLCAIMLLSFSSFSQRLMKRGLCSRRALVWPVIFCLFACSASFLAMAAHPQGAFGLALLALGTALVFPVSASIPILISEVVPLHQRNPMLVAILSFTSLSGMIGPYLTGLIVGDRGLEGYQGALLLCAGVVSIGGILALTALHPAAAAARLAALDARLNTEGERDAD